MTDLWRTIILGVVEGVTEFLPISSTGHMVIIDNWIGKAPDKEFWNMFEIVIQIGAIMAVVVYFRERILEILRGPKLQALTPLEISMSVGKSRATTAAAPTDSESAVTPPAFASPTVKADEVADQQPAGLSPQQRIHLIGMILLASVPLVVPALLEKRIERVMGIQWIIAAALGVGGILMIIIEKMNKNPQTLRMDKITWQQALVIGCCQILAALFPGTSRSAATIMGGLAVGLNRWAAAEFSFFLAIPAMFAACGYKLLKFLKSHPQVSGHQMFMLFLGTLISFIVAWVVVAAFMSYIRRHSFVSFGIYRIILAIVVLLVIFVH